MEGFAGNLVPKCPSIAVNGVALPLGEQSLVFRSVLSNFGNFIQIYEDCLMVNFKGDRRLFLFDVFLSREETF